MGTWYSNVTFRLEVQEQLTSTGSQYLEERNNCYSANPKFLY